MSDAPITETETNPDSAMSSGKEDKCTRCVINYQLTETDTLVSGHPNLCPVTALTSVDVSSGQTTGRYSELPSPDETKSSQNDGKVEEMKIRETSLTLQPVDVFSPKPSPRLKKHKKAMAETASHKIGYSLKQDESIVINNTLNDCKTNSYQKDCEIQNLQNCVKLEKMNFIECSKEKESIEDLVRSQLNELKQIKVDLLKLLEEGNKTDAISIKEAESKVVDKLRKDLRKKSCLLRDAQLYISKLEKRKDVKPEINMLKDKIESLEDEKRYLTKVKREFEDDLTEIRLEKENFVQRERLMEKKYKEKAEENLTLTQQLIENEESIEEIMSKYKSVINSISKYQKTIEDQSEELGKLSMQNKKLEEDLETCTSGRNNSTTNWRKSLELEKITRIKVCSYLILEF